MDNSNTIQIENKERFYGLVLDHIWENGVYKIVYINLNGEIIIIPPEGYLIDTYMNMYIGDYNEYRRSELYDILEIRGSKHRENFTKSENFKNIHTLDQLVEYCSVLKRKREAKKRKKDKELFPDIYDKIAKPKIDIRKETGNTKEKTFDFISVEIPICISDHEEALQYCKDHLRKLVDYAIYKLKKSKMYTSYDVPTNFLKIDKITLTSDSMLELLFCLKEI